MGKKLDQERKDQEATVRRGLAEEFDQQMKILNADGVFQYGFMGSIPERVQLIKAKFVEHAFDAIGLYGLRRAQLILAPMPERIMVGMLILDGTGRSCESPHWLD